MTEPERRIAELRTLLARLGHHRATIERVAQRIDRAVTRAAAHDPEAVAATALHLQHYYTGIEDALVAVAQELDGSVPKDPEWHRLLLEQMSLDIPAVRPRLLNPDLAPALDVLRRFRRRVRHAYDEEPEWGKMAEPLEARSRVTELLPSFFAAVERLIEDTIRALETPGR